MQVVSAMQASFYSYSGYNGNPRILWKFGENMKKKNTFYQPYPVLSSWVLPQWLIEIVHSTAQTDKKTETLSLDAGPPLQGPARALAAEQGWDVFGLVGVLLSMKF